MRGGKRADAVGRRDQSGESRTDSVFKTSGSGAEGAARRLHASKALWKCAFSQCVYVHSRNILLRSIARQIPVFPTWVLRSRPKLWTGHAVQQWGKKSFGILCVCAMCCVELRISLKSKSAAHFSTNTNIKPHAKMTPFVKF